jgi:catechol 2,3-dioxygenase-like lactoylglutathione lyase family enzyme
MARNPFGHVDIRVNDREVAKTFYEQLLPELGFATFERGENFDCFYADGEHPFRPWFGYVQDRDHVPNGNRIAFSVENRAEVDRIAEVARAAGARDVSGPKVMLDYEDGYYAVFFDDPFGNPLEIVHTAR